MNIVNALKSIGLGLSVIFYPVIVVVSLAVSLVLVVVGAVIFVVGSFFYGWFLTAESAIKTIKGFKEENEGDRI